MATTQVLLEEYLSTDYEPDCDYVDGELEERNVGEQEHSITQAFFIKWLAKHEDDWKLEACPEIRMRVSRGRVRVADIAVLPLNRSFEAVLTTPPVAIIEIALAGRSRLSLSATAGRLSRHGRCQYLGHRSHASQGIRLQPGWVAAGREASICGSRDRGSSRSSLEEAQRVAFLEASQIMPATPLQP